MQGIEWIGAGLLGLVLLGVAVRLLAGRLRWLALWLFRSAVGAAALWCLQWPASIVGWHVGVNLWTSLAVGALGIPGIAALYAVQAIFP